ncbi:M48 family metallopeptidase [Tenacibaculum finnmarkense]|uniref:M48 family metallopeptidase n=1 Tax=Tenacibaculum finnmarkense TaxID=2781243 RepID=UPI001E46FC93|nr:SprT family zinc-dependent metalloprotease [Tenacibaculum finnmarkense]MCD8445988.1 M48 family metallopeptidase [Tenacibaculum finnmarkense genomovar finnmarkense]WCC46640.1 SprT family zinc-dependent metalloprotease [Tenacibaculum finnmarkense]
MEFNRIIYGNSTIDFQLIYKNRKTLGIKVHPDGEVIVSAPLDATLEKIIEKVKKKAQWIFMQKTFFLNYEPRTSEKTYQSGEGHLYLGKMYRLKVTESNNKSIKLKRGYICIETKDKTQTNKIKEQLNEWYKSKAILHFNTIYNSRLGLIKELSEKETSLKYKWFNNRWGSCFSDGTIYLNIELIKAPKECIDYVLIHEICHLKYHNHSTSFYELLGEKLPNWKKSKEKLEKLLS